MSRVIAVLVAALAWLALPGAGGATVSFAVRADAVQVPSLERIDSLTARGRVEAAREMLTAWWDARFEGAPPLERQRALWLRGKLTVDPGMARRDYLRLILEYPGGPHSADALLRLGQTEHGAGRMAAAGRYFEQLLRDYPDSPHRLEARRWLDENRAAVARARAEAPRGPPERARQGPDDGAGRAEPPSSDAGAPEPEPSGGDPPATSPASAGPISVQLGAFSSEERARELTREVRAEGVDGLRLVRVGDSPLTRVRAGRFPDREAAEALRAQLRDAGFDAVIVTDTDGERPVP